MRRSAFIPDFWIESGLSDAAFRTVSLLNLYRDQKNRVSVTNVELAAKLKKDTRRVQDDLNRAMAAGLIERHFDDKGKRYFILILDRTTDDARRHGVTENVVGGCRVASGGDDAARHGGMTPSVTLPQTPFNRNNHSLTDLSNLRGHEATNTHTDQNNPIEALGQKPKPIPDQILRMASQIGLEGWVGEVQFQEIDTEDWRVKETLVRIKGLNKQVNGRYAWQIFNGLPAEKPPAQAIGFKTTKVDHIPNVMPPAPEKSEFSAIKTTFFNRIGELNCDFEIINNLMDQIEAEPVTGDPRDYRQRLESIFQRSTQLNGTYK